MTICNKVVYILLASRPLSCVRVVIISIYYLLIIKMYDVYKMCDTCDDGFEKIIQQLLLALLLLVYD